MAVVFHFEFEYSLRKLRGTEYVVVNALLPDLDVRTFVPEGSVKDSNDEDAVSLNCPPRCILQALTSLRRVLSSWR
jgi:hypothetical protein